MPKITLKQTGSVTTTAASGALFDVALPTEVDDTLSVCMPPQSRGGETTTTRGYRDFWQGKLSKSGSETPGKFDQITFRRISNASAGTVYIEWTVIEFDPTSVVQVIHLEESLTGAPPLNVDLTSFAVADYTQCIPLDNHHTYGTQQGFMVTTVSHRSSLTSNTNFEFEKVGTSNFTTHTVWVDIVEFVAGTISTTHIVGGTIASNVSELIVAIGATVDQTKCLFSGDLIRNHTSSNTDIGRYVTSQRFNSDTEVRFYRKRGSSGAHYACYCEAQIFEFASGITVTRHNYEMLFAGTTPLEAETPITFTAVDEDNSIVWHGSNLPNQNIRYTDGSPGLIRDAAWFTTALLDVGGAGISVARTHKYTTNDTDLEGTLQLVEFDTGAGPAGWTGIVNGVINPASVDGVVAANISNVMGVS